MFFFSGNRNISEYGEVGVMIFYLKTDSCNPHQVKNQLSVLERIAINWRKQMLTTYITVFPCDTTSPSPILALQWKGASLRCSLAQLFLAASKSCCSFGEGSSSTGICPSLSCWQRAMLTPLVTGIRTMSAVYSRNFWPSRLYIYF